MSNRSIGPGAQIIVVAVSVGREDAWTWRIITRGGRLVLQSEDRYPGLIEALEDGRRHLGDVPAADLEPDSPVETAAWNAGRRPPWAGAGVSPGSRRPVVDPASQAPPATG
jgi:hypothetical protein